MYEACDPSVKMNYLLALIRFLQGIPKHLVQTEITSTVILLLESLDTDKPDVILMALEILCELLENKELVLGDHINSFTPKFIKLAEFDGNMKIRIVALKCLFFYGFYPTFKLLPLKNMVIFYL